MTPYNIKNFKVREVSRIQYAFTYILSQNSYWKCLYVKLASLVLWCGAAATRRRRRWRQRRQRRTWQDSGVWRCVPRAARRGAAMARRGGGGTSDHFNARLTCA